MLLSVVFELLDISIEMIFLLFQLFLLTLISLALLIIILVTNRSDLFGLFIDIWPILRDLIRSFEYLISPGKCHNSLSLFLIKFAHIDGSTISSGHCPIPYRLVFVHWYQRTASSPLSFRLTVIIPSNPNLSLIRDKRTLSFSAFYVNYVISILLQLTYII